MESIPQKKFKDFKSLDLRFLFLFQKRDTHLPLLQNQTCFEEENTEYRYNLPPISLVSLLEL